MNRGTLIGAIVVLAGAGGWYWYSQRAGAPAELITESPVAEATAGIPATAPQEPVHPLEASPTPDAPALPPLADSDAPLVAEIGQLTDEGTVLAWLVPESVVRRFVTTVDNLPRTHLAERSRVLRGAPGTFEVERTVVDATSGEERIVAAPANVHRYDGAIAALQAVDMQQVAVVYRRWYPLLQQAYEDIGYPGRYFNDRVVAVIDHLLETPVPLEPPLLVQPKVLYQYADASMEARSAGQKLLMRLGADHAAVVKSQLSRLRAAIANDISKKE